MCRGWCCRSATCPGAPAQGAIADRSAGAVAICRAPRGDLASADVGRRPARSAKCSRRHGGGCHEALGATVLPREYGRVVSIKGRSSTGASRRRLVARPPPGSCRRRRSRRRSGRGPTSVSAPRAGRSRSRRHRDGRGILGRARGGAARLVDRRRRIGSSGPRAARRGAGWPRAASGCTAAPTVSATASRPNIDTLAGRHVSWHRLTHRAAASADPDALATYEVRGIAARRSAGAHALLLDERHAVSARPSRAGPSSSSAGTAAGRAARGARSAGRSGIAPAPASGWTTNNGRRTILAWQ